MEAESSSRPADGGEHGEQREQRPASSEPRPPQQQQPPNPRRGGGGGPGRLHQRQPRRSDLLLRLQQQQAVAWRQHSDAGGPSGGSFLSPPPSSTSPPSSSSSSAPGEQQQHPPGGGVLPQPQPSQDGGPPEVPSSRGRGDKKPQKPGKYVCTYCGRPCAKPSVLQKHIRSHTGERPYPCAPCGFSFKTKSNLYKHRKSHAHRIKAGLVSAGRDEPGLSGDAEAGGPGEEPGEEPPTEGESTDSEEETGEHRHKDRPGQRRGGQEPAPVPGGPEEAAQRPEDSLAVKQRLAMRLSERKRGPLMRASPDDPPSSSSLSASSSSSLGPGSKGSTESGYFSGSGSTELSQVSPPSASAKTYAEIILGKYGRLGGQQRGGPHHHHQQHLLLPPSSSSLSSGAGEEKGMSFSVPKTQVIEHITKLITINEAVVDTSEIDSVKPRRSSLSRKSSSESAKLPRDAYDSKGEARLLGPGGSGDPSAVPLFRSHSVPSASASACAGQADPSAPSSPPPRGGYRLSHSFDEQRAVLAEMRVGHAQRMLKRQPAIEVPLGAELLLEGAGPSSSSSSARGAEPARTSYHLHQHQQQQQKFECAACGAPCQEKDSYEAHRASCPGQPRPDPGRGDVGGKQRDDRPQMMHYKFRALAMAVRKRRKEESLDEDPPSPASTGPTALQPGCSTEVLPTEHSHALSGVPFQTTEAKHQDRKGVSVIQHTSSFEKQESIMMSTEEECHEPRDPPQSPVQQQAAPPQPKASSSAPPSSSSSSSSSSRLLQRQPNIQVPEILVTVEPDTDMPSVSPPATVSSSKEPEKVEEFQWPQRSQSMAQLPPEKLPPKKKRLRLAEASPQSSGESSFESNVSYASSSLSASAEEAAAGRLSSSSGQQQQGSQMLTVPSSSSSSHQSSQSQQNREMRRSASEQTQTPDQSAAEEARSKSFDYGSLSSPRHPASAWKERRKCLLVKHATLGKPEQEEPGAQSPKPGPSYSGHPTARYCLPEAGARGLTPETVGKTLQLFQQPRILPPPPLSQGALALQPRAWEAAGFGRLLSSANTVISEVQIVHRAFLRSHAASPPPPIRVHPAQIHVAERLGIPLHRLPSSFLPIQFPSSGESGAAYLPGPSELTARVPSPIPRPSGSSSTSPPPAHHQRSLVPRSSCQSRPVIITCLAQLTPVVSLVVPVRLQTHVPHYACATDTTLSQILASSARSHQDPICCTTMVIMGHLERRDKMHRTSYLKIPVPDIKSYLPLSLPAELASGASGSDEGGCHYGPLGAGGSKRMLSPAASLELSTEAQRHQKRVKEEEEEEVEQKREGEPEEEEEEAREEEEKESKATGSKLEEEEEEAKGASVKVEGDQKEEQCVPKKLSWEEEEEEEATKEAKPKREEEEEEEVTVVQREGVALGGRVATAPQRAPQSPPERPVGLSGPPGLSSHPSLNTATSVNWCYLNYVKPNPSVSRGDPLASVYATWSVSVHNPNLPGLSTKVALSLLCSKQRHSAQTYTMATGSPGPEDRGKLSAASSSSSSSTPHQCASEVHAAPPGAPVEVKEPPPHPPHKEDKKKGKREEEGASTSKQGEQPPRVRIFEGGYRSSEEYVYVRGRGRGKYVCGECGIRCKKPSMLRKHIRTHTDLRPYVCKHCNFAFKTKGNLTKHMKSKAHGKKCQAMGMSESSLDEPESEEAGGSEERACGSEEQEDHQFSDAGESGEEEENEGDEEDEDEEEEEEEEEEESSSHDDPPSSCSSHDTRPSTRGRRSSSGSGGGRRSQQGTPDPDSGPLPAGLSPSHGQEKAAASPRRRLPWPGGGRKATSPGSRRAVYSQRRAPPRAFSSPSSESCGGGGSPGSRSLSPRLDLMSSPLRSLSPRTDLSSPGPRHLSPSPERGPSPVRAASPSLRCRHHRLPPPGGGFRSGGPRAQVSPSPLRLLQHRPPAYLPWETPGTKSTWERGGTAGEVPMSPEATLFPPAFRLPPGDAHHPGHQAADHVFSHLPMHSQQAKLPYLMIPIGGIQMVQAGPRSHPTTTATHHHPTSPPKEGPSLARFEWSSWGWTPRTPGLRTPGPPWSDSQGTGASRSAPAGSKPQTETTDSKQYGSSYSFTHTHRHATPGCVATVQTAERCCLRDSYSRPPLGRFTPSPSPSHGIGQPPEWEERRSVAEPVEGGANKGETDGSDQST